MKPVLLKKSGAFQAEGPNSSELSDRDALIGDYYSAEEIMALKGRKVSVFGGGGILHGSHYYEKARVFAQNIATAGISVMTGGGTGIMEAANRGVHESKSNVATSYGIRVKEITYENKNLFVHTEYEFNTLALRLVTLISISDVIICFPGGFGTLEETFSTLVRMRVGLLKKMPVYLFGEGFWRGLTEWMENTLLKEEVIDQPDLQLFTVFDDVDTLSEQVISYIKSLE
ncbi:MAG: TIGR00730 family Rossman fold protein [Holosporales bacterium]|jgi:uncharacterized protein (TIGR00730 family)|nr:TIGR00730 family Rossman fold protein [Holosporales bacterium]